MKKFLPTVATNPKFLLLAMGALLVCSHQTAYSQADQTWRDGEVNNDWDLTTPNWDAGAVWLNGNNAIFGGTGETVEVASDLTVNNLTFNSTGYIVADANNDSVLSLLAGSVITTGTGVTATISEAIAAGAITKQGEGTLVLTGANGFEGNVSIAEGRLIAGSNGALGNTVGTTSVTSGAQLQLGDGVVITGESLEIAGSGLSFTGALSVAAGESGTWAGAVNIGSGGRFGAAAGGVLTVSGPISGGNLVLSAFGSGEETGVLVVSNTGNTYGGQTQIIRGILRLGATNALPATTLLNIDSANSPTEPSIFDLAGYNQTIATLTRTATSEAGSFITNTGNVASTLTVNQSGSSTYSGILQDVTAALNIEKTGTGTLTLSGDNAHSGTTTVSEGTLILSGNGTATGEVIATTTGVLIVASNGALGSTSAGTVVNTGSRAILNDGIVVTGETITIAGTGGNNNGALQTAENATAEWAGNIISNSADARIGGGAGGTLIVSGVISGATSLRGILFSRGNNSTTILNNVNTYTGDTQIFANAGDGSRLVMGVDNAINEGSQLSVISANATRSMVLDLNGHLLTLRGLNTATNHSSGNFLFIENNGATPTTFSVSGSTGTFVWNGRMRDGTGGLSFVKNGAGIQTIIAPQSYTGSTTVNAGTLQIGGAVTTLGVNGSLASANLVLKGGTLAFDNLGANNNSGNRLADTSSITFEGGTFVYRGSELANSSETMGSLVVGSKRSVMTMTFGGSQTAALTASGLTRSANGGTLLLNGINLGMDGSSTASVSRILLTAAPTLVGTTDALSTGINAAAKNTKIVPFLLGEATATAGGLGTATGTANTFVTYDPATGLRPLNLADEFTNNAFTTGHNVYITSPTNVGGSATINSLILSGSGATIGTGNTLTVESGAVFFSSGSGLTLGGGVLNFGNREGIITMNSTGNTTLTTRIIGTAGVSFYGTGTLVTNQQHTFSGDTGLYLGAVIPQVSSVGTPGAVVSGPLGTGTIIMGGASIRASTSGDVVLHNDVRFLANMTVLGATGARNLTFAGDVILEDGIQTVTNQTTANTYFTGVISSNAAGDGFSVAGNGAGQVVLSGDNTYAGPTSLTGNTTLLINGDQSAATGAVTVTAGVLGGTGTLGGATTIGNGGTLSPGDPAAAGGIGRLSMAQGLTLQVGSITSLEITGASFTSLDSFGGNAPGSPEYMAYVLANGSGQGNHDQIVITGSINQETGGRIQVMSAGFTPAEGQIFNLLDWSASLGNSFSENLGDTYRTGADDNLFDLDLPDISSSGLAWDISFFASHGIVVVIPEPGRAALLMLGLALAGMRRRR
ncbi:autotransporter-associated beta strand repeat-containing protein [Prosthecobacter sp. SYSU 5D2]|uniref:beta strand repeat-containing protein n=1 Tax=Prosthecobacter sp. SYSU 5D2 TaxID=3134134 RepID=UPI0031FECE10